MCARVINRMRVSTDSLLRNINNTKALIIMRSRGEARQLKRRTNERTNERKKWRKKVSERKMACFVSILTHHFHHSKNGHTHTRTHTIKLNVLYCVRWCICLRVEWFRIINSQWTGIIYTELSMNHNEHDPANTCKTMCENTVEICLSISPCSSLSVCPSALCECEWCTVKIHLFLSVAIKILWFASMYLSFSLRFFCAALQNQPFYLFLLHWCFQL